MLVMPYSQERILGWLAYLLRLDEQVLSQLTLCDCTMTSSESPLFSPASVPPALSPPLSKDSVFFKYYFIMYNLGLSEITEWEP